MPALAPDDMPTAAIRALGIRTRPMPVSETTGMVDTALLCRDRRLTAGLAAVLAVHLHGLTCDVPALRAARPGLTVIEDAASAWAARYPDGAPVGSAADMCVFSFKAGRSLSAGELGCLVTRTPSLFTAAVALTQHPVRQLLDGVSRPHTDQVMMCVAPAVALLGAYVVQAHAGEVAVLRRAAARLSGALRRDGLAVLTDPKRHEPGVVAVRATASHVRHSLRGVSLGRSVVITSVDQPVLRVYPGAQPHSTLRELAAAVTTVTAAVRTSRRQPRTLPAAGRTDVGRQGGGGAGARSWYGLASGIHDPALA